MNHNITLKTENCHELVASSQTIRRSYVSWTPNVERMSNKLTFSQVLRTQKLVASPQTTRRSYVSWTPNVVGMSNKLTFSQVLRTQKLVASPWKLRHKNVKAEAKAQMTLFIIIALVIIALIGISVYLFKFSGDTSTQEKVSDLTQPPKTIKEFVDRCVYETSVSGIGLLASQGGMIYVDEYIAQSLEDAKIERQKFGVLEIPTSNPPAENAKVESAKIVYGYYQNINALPSIPEMEIELEDYISSALGFCTHNFTGSAFASLGADMLTVGEPTAEVQIGLDKVIVTLNYPITYTDLIGKTTIDTFTIEIPLRLGYLHAIADAAIEKQRLDPDYVDVTFLSDLSNGLVSSESNNEIKTSASSETPDSEWTDDSKPVEPKLVQDSSPALDKAIAKIPQGYKLAGRIDIAEYDDESMILVINDTSLVFLSAIKFVKNKFPVILMEDVYQVKEGKAFVLMVEVDDDDTEHTFTDDTSLFDITKEGMISFTPEVPGTYEVTITAADPHDNHGIKNLKFIVDEKSLEEMEG